MRTHLELASGRRCDVDLDRGIDVGIRLNLSGTQPSAFGVDRAVERPLTMGETVFDTGLGGSCNVSTVVVTPHCNGTHTESARHITNDGPSIHSVVPLGLTPATLLTVKPERGAATRDDYRPEKRDDDQLITRSTLEALGAADPDFLEAVLIRTRPNPRSKQGRDYAKQPGPYLSIQAITYLLQLGVRHLLVDTASIDRPDDGGRMHIHHEWFGVEQGESTCDDDAGARRTVTELIFVPDGVRDGRYLLQIHIAPFDSDAAPSRPILFPIHDREGQ